MTNCKWCEMPQTGDHRCEINDIYLERRIRYALTNNDQHELMLIHEIRMLKEIVKDIIPNIMKLCKELKQDFSIMTGDIKTQLKEVIEIEQEN